jgi:PPE-repeat protein
MSALLTVKDSLRLRAWKENTGGSAIVRGAKSIAGQGGIGAAIGAAGSENKLEGAVKGGLIGAGVKYGLPAAAHGIDRTINTLAIKALRKGAGGPTAGQVGNVARGAGRIAAGLGIGRPDPTKPDDDEETDEERKRREAEER